MYHILFWHKQTLFKLCSSEGWGEPQTFRDLCCRYQDRLSTGWCKRKKSWLLFYVSHCLYKQITPGYMTSLSSIGLQVYIFSPHLVCGYPLKSILPHGKINTESWGNILKLMELEVTLNKTAAAAAAAAAAKSLQSCPTLGDPIDGSPPGSLIPGILQARTLEWVASSFSSAWKWKVKVKSLSRVRLLATSWTAAHQAPPSMAFSRQEYWSGVAIAFSLSKTEGTQFPWQLSGW